MGCNRDGGTQVGCMGEQGTEAGTHASQAPADKLKSQRQATFLSKISNYMLGVLGVLADTCCMERRKTVLQ